MNSSDDRASQDVFTVFGRPAGQGSKKQVRTRRGRTVMLETSQHLMPWRSAVTTAALLHKCSYRDGPVSLVISVRWPRPASHLNRKGDVKPSAPSFPSMVDIDKLARSILDALTGVAYRDDRQVVCLTIRREWCSDGTPSHAEIRIAGADASQ